VHLQPAQKKHWPRAGRQRGTTEAAADEYEQSESPIGAKTPGNGRQPDPVEQRGLVSRRT